MGVKNDAFCEIHFSEKSVWSLPYEIVSECSKGVILHVKWPIFIRAMPGEFWQFFFLVLSLMENIWWTVPYMFEVCKMKNFIFKGIWIAICVH